MARSSLLQLLVFIVALGNARAVRVKLFPEEEPSSPEFFNKYRVAFASQDLYHLEAADLLQDSTIASELPGESVGQNGQIKSADFRFDSAKHQQAILEAQYFVPYDERAALQVYDDPEEMDRASGPQVDQELCGLHLDYMHHMAQKSRRNVANSSEYSIFKILDTYEWPGYGLSRGRNVFMGDYRGCLDLKLNVMRKELDRVNKSASDKYFKEKKVSRQSLLQVIINNLGPFFGRAKQTLAAQQVLQNNEHQLRALPMRYCLASIRLPTWESSSHYKRNIALRTAVCLPETCDSRSLKVHGNKIKQLTDLQSNKFFADYYISDLYCLPDEQSELRNPFSYSRTISFILFNIVWITLIILSEVTSNSYLNCWSIRRNVQGFLSGKKGKADTATEPPARVNLRPLEGMKICAALMVIAAHAFGINVGAAWNSNEAHKYIGHTYVGSLLTICPTSVDIFFVITGMLTNYLLLSNNRKSLLKPAFWVSFIVYRYIRIVPLYALVHWFLNSGFRFIGSGPMWDYGTSHSAWSKICQDESWWEIFLPQANMKSPNKTCNTVGWYLSNDIQFTLITPIFVVLYALKPKLAHALTGATVVALVENHVRYYMQFAAGAHNVFKWDLLTFTSVFHDATDGYVMPQYRVVSYLIGLAAGYILFEYSRRDAVEASSKWPRSFVKCAKIWMWLNLYLVWFLPSLSTLVPLNNKELVQTLAPTLLGTMHATASVSTAIFALLICTGHLSERLRGFLGWPCFETLASASLSIVLVQVPLILYHTQTIRTLPELSHYHLISSLVIWCIETILLAGFVHVVYEVPIRRFLVKFMLNSLGARKEEEQQRQNGIPQTNVSVATISKIKDS